MEVINNNETEFLRAELESAKFKLVELQIKLENTEKKYKSLFYNMSEGVALHEIVYDENHKPVNYKIIDVNNRFEFHTGLKKETVIGKLATDAYKVSEAPYIEDFEKLEKTGQSVYFETYFAPMNKYFSVSAFSIQKGKFATIFCDITNIKLNGEKLYKSNQILKTQAENMKSELERYKEIIDNLPTISCGIKPDGTITFVNKTCETITGYASEELIGNNWWNLFYPGDLYLQAIKLLQILDINDVIDYEMILVDKKGKKKIIIPVHVNN
ncbi:MAG: PAS domain S-box protein [Cyanobacteriota bacterium]